MDQESTQILQYDQEPIVALSSGREASAIAVLRATGNNCLNLIKHCLNPLGLAPFTPGKMRLCDFKDPETGDIIDQPMAVYFAGPASYTGQDSVEIFLHGGPWIVQKSLSILYQQGFRPADPGEFTRRAYLNGKLDLTAAEGIRSMVEASSRQEWLAARQLATGRLKTEIESLRLRVMEAMAWLEARIDFPDEKETSEVEWAQIDTKVSDVILSVDKLLNSFESGRVASQGLRVTIFGKPNAGKSTLLNELLGEERAIVTDIPGTTRDYIEEPCLINGRLIRIVDTAGVRDSEDTVEKIGIDRSIELARDSDLVLFLLPTDGTHEDYLQMSEWGNSVKNPGQSAFLLTKSDLGSRPQWLDEDTRSWISLSCQNQNGIDSLKELLASKVDAHLNQLEKEKTFITSPRHKKALEDASVCLNRYSEARKNEAYEEVLAFELLELARVLGSIIGEVDSDDILGVIFSSFCVGK